LRDRLGEREDRFFATVFLGSGLLFLAMLFFSAAVAGGIIIAFVAAPERLLGSPTFTFGRHHPRDHEHLCNQDGGGVHDRYVHARAAHRFHRALDCVPRLCAVGCCSSSAAATSKGS
ncbi:MAG: hypothetical protein ACREV8_01560, partial [Gammaproteobacteria bacterium]